VPHATTLVLGVLLACHSECLALDSSLVQRAIKDHIAELIELLKEFNEQLARENDALTRAGIEADVRAANMALTHYQLALELEEKLKATRRSKQDAGGR
jgi:predicted lipoprotein